MSYQIITLNGSESLGRRADQDLSVIHYNVHDKTSDHYSTASRNVSPTGELYPLPTAQDSYGYGRTEGIIISIVLSSFIIFAVAGNILVIIAILTDRHLRRTSNYFIVSLAVADALVAIIVMTFSLVNEVLGRWIFGDVLCNIWISSDVMCSTASIMNLCAISLDRYIHIRNPLHYDIWITRNRTLLAISGIWIISALISFLPIHLGWHQLGRDIQNELGATDLKIEPLDNNICVLDISPVYAVTSSAVSFFLPCIMMISIYVKLYRYARIHVKNIRRTQITFQPKNDFPPGKDSGSSPGSAMDAKSRLSDHKAAVTLGVIMGVFLFCWAPFFTANVIGACCQSCIPPVVFSTFTWLGYMNSTMNPVIYSIFNQEFSAAFKRVLLAGKRCSKSRDSDFRFESSDFRYQERLPLNPFCSDALEAGRVNESRHSNNASPQPTFL